MLGCVQLVLLVGCDLSSELTLIRRLTHASCMYNLINRLCEVVIFKSNCYFKLFVSIDFHSGRVSIQVLLPLRVLK